MGQDLGLGFLGLSHEVKMESRDPNKKEIREWLAKAGNKASAMIYIQNAIRTGNWDCAFRLLRKSSVSSS